MKNDNDLFSTCSLIEYMGRDRKRKRSEIVDCLGRERLDRIYRYADVLHCEPIAKAADEFITQCQIRMGEYDNVKKMPLRSAGLLDHWGSIWEAD